MKLSFQKKSYQETLVTKQSWMHEDTSPDNFSHLCFFSPGQAPILGVSNVFFCDPHGFPEQAMIMKGVISGSQIFGC